MTVRTLLKDATAQLTTAGASDAALDAGWLLAQTLHLPRLQLAVEGQREVTEAEQEKFEVWLARRVAGEPLQYILGTQDFMGQTFEVDARVLIPRQDTETLCEAAIARIGDQVVSVLDMGTGSGALAVSIALACKNTQVTAVDISENALALAKRNAVRLGADVRWLQSDLLEALGDEKYDMIVSNPPYLTREDLDTLQKEVRREPNLALDGGEDGLDIYRRMIPQLPEHLCPGGICLLEVGKGQAGDVGEMLRTHVGEPFTLRDLCGVERVVCAILE